VNSLKKEHNVIDSASRSQIPKFTIDLIIPNIKKIPKSKKEPKQANADLEKRE